MVPQALRSWSGVSAGLLLRNVYWAHVPPPGQITLIQLP